MASYVDQNMGSKENVSSAVIGQIMVCTDRKLLASVFARLLPSDFLNPKDRQIFEVSKTIFESGFSPDLVTISDELIARGMMVGVDNSDARLHSRAELIEYTDNVYTAALLPQYIQRMIETKVKIGLRTRLLEMPLFHMSTPDLLLEVQSIQRLVAGLVLKESGIVSGADLVALRGANIATYCETIPVFTGYKTIDRHLTYGFARGQISIIAARPGIGKSALKANIINHLCENGFSVFNVNVEQTTFVEQNRLDALRLRIPLIDIIRMRNWDSEDPRFQLLRNNVEHIAKKWRYTTIDTEQNAEVTIDNLEKFIDRITEEQGGLDICFLDLFDRFADVDMDSPAVVHKKLKQLDRLAKDKDVHICVLAQIHRLGDPNKVKDMRPRLDDIKWSGSFEEVARLVLLLHREAKYKKDLPDDRLEICIAKQNDGLSGEFVSYELGWDSDFLAIFDTEEELPKIEKPPARKREKVEPIGEAAPTGGRPTELGLDELI